MLINKSDINIILDNNENIFKDELENFYKICDIEKLILSIDFEFNSKKIALMQLAFEYEKKSNYYIIYPPKISNDIINFFIEKILINKKIKKIMHGCESLDIPYIYNELFNNNIEYITLFTQSLYDTRYFCEYNNLYYKYDNKCSLYEGLKNNNIINDNIYKYLMNNEKNMGNIWQINIDINNLSDQLIYYSIYDVIFLKKFFINLNKELKKINKFNYYLFNELFRFILLERNNKTNILNDIIININKFNQYFIIHNNNKFTLIDIFNNLSQLYFFFNDNSKIINNINYLKLYQSHIYRLFFYNYLFNKKDIIIYESKNKIINLSLINDCNKIINISYYIKNDIYKFQKYLDELDINYGEFIK